ncbi:hypothetical protein [Aquibacillus saliphilus]|uniref:hypothetical protein n=1 Tax=Aquibacillus saliphilus TaxID=1909422 RepID=UPI001CF0B936|nr:hypothetical protein [Aquibacillus saliphilus]
METISDTVINTIIGDLKEEYEGNTFDLIKELENGLQNNVHHKDGANHMRLNFVLSQIIEECPELYAQHWSSLTTTLDYYKRVIQS